MKDLAQADIRELVVPPELVLDKLEPGMKIFLSTGLAEPRTLVRHLMNSDANNLQDLELIQIVSLGDLITMKEIKHARYRLKTFFSGWVASEAIHSGRVDLIPSRFSMIPSLIESGRVPVDVAFVQISPPNDAGFCSLGISVDVAREAMEKASMVVGEINNHVPMTYGDTFVPITDFDYLVMNTEPPLTFPRWQADETFDKVAENVASVIEDGSCLAFSIGPLFEALAPHLMRKKHLGVHSPFFTDPVMDLVKAGAISNRFKNVFRGKSLCSYAFGTAELMDWLHKNPLVEFQSISKVCSPLSIGRNARFVAVLPARKVDLTGRIALHFGKGNVAAGPSEALEFFNGAEISSEGRTVFALPSRNLKGEANVRISVAEYPNQFILRESVDLVVTEWGVAYLHGRTVRERAQALIDIAHPDDRADLVQQAKDACILYKDQIYLAETAATYPSEINEIHTFKNDTKVRFRPIRPSDEEGMRRLFYRFSDRAVYYRYFSPIKTMPHKKMQEYVNVDFNRTMSIVGMVGEAGQADVIAEARYVLRSGELFADVAFVVDEQYQGLGIATFLYQMLVRIAKERGLEGFTADVLATNKAMLKVFEKGDQRITAQLESGVYELRIPFQSQKGRGEKGIRFVQNQ